MKTLPFGARSLDEAVRATRAQIVRAQALLLDRQYKRDKDGQFATTTGGKHVREALAGHETAEEVSAAAMAEAKRITGRDIEFDLAGSDPQLAAEHSEGILRGLERYPNTPLERVQHGGNRYAEGEEAWAATSLDGRVISFTEDAQRYGAASYRQELKQAAQGGDLAVGTPMGVALHEFGHAAANHYRLNGWADNKADAYAEIHMGSTDMRASVSKAISRRAAENAHELSAEAFADVAVHGDKASGMSREIVSFFDAEIRAVDSEVDDE